MSSTEDDLQLADFVALFRRRWPWVVGVFLVGLALVAVFTFTRDEEYRSRAEVLVLTQNSRSLFALDESTKDRLTRSPEAELQFASSQSYRQASNQAAGFSGNVDIELVLPEGSTRIEDSSVLRMTALDRTPERAQGAAQAYADTYIELRHAQDVEGATSALTAAETRLAELEAERAELEAPLVELRLERSLETDPQRRAQLDAEIQRQQNEITPLAAIISTQIAEARATQYELEQSLAALEATDAAARVLNGALVPVAPISPDVPRNLLLGGLAALVLGLVAAVFREFLDGRTWDAARVAQATGLPVIGAIPGLATDRSAPGGVRDLDDQPPAAIDAYRGLFNSLWLGAGSQPVLSLGVAGPRAGTGSTQTVVNLARTVVRHGARVVVVDADFGSPSVAERMGVEPGTRGLGDVLHGWCDVDEVIRSTDVEGLELIEALGAEAFTPDLVRRGRLVALLRTLGARYDLVLFDLSPLLERTDSRLVAAQIDAAVLVYDERRTQRVDLVSSVELLGGAGARVMGLVANRARRAHLSYPEPGSSGVSAVGSNGRHGEVVEPRAVSDGRDVVTLSAT